MKGNFKKRKSRKAKRLSIEIRKLSKFAIGEWGIWSL